MKFGSLADAPASVRCLLCGQEKPIAEIIVFRGRRDGSINVRRRCKQCHNARERGHRREWKAEYLRQWRRKNAELNRSYWTERSQKMRAELTARAGKWRAAHLQSYRIQVRLRHRGYNITIDDAAELLASYGPAYPLRAGLSPEGLREAERRRSEHRRAGRRVPLWRITLDLWETPKYRLAHRAQPKAIAGRSEAIRAYWRAQNKEALDVAV